jgi:hypothetical protein
VCPRSRRRLRSPLRRRPGMILPARGARGFTDDDHVDCRRAWRPLRGHQRLLPQFSRRSSAFDLHPFWATVQFIAIAWSRWCSLCFPCTNSIFCHCSIAARILHRTCVIHALLLWRDLTVAWTPPRSMTAWEMLPAFASVRTAMATPTKSSANTSRSWYGIQPSVSTVDTSKLIWAFASSICMLDHVILLPATCSKSMWCVRGIVCGVLEEYVWPWGMLKRCTVRWSVEEWYWRITGNC